MTDDSILAHRRDEHLIVRAALAITPETLPASQLPQARTHVETAMQMLDKHLGDIRYEMEKAAALEEAHTPQWWGKASYAKRIKVRQRQRLQTIFGDINRLIRAVRREHNAIDQTTKERRFIQLVRPHISDWLYRELWEIVNKEFGSDG